MASGKASLVSREVVMGYVDDIAGVLSQGTRSDQRAFLKSFISDIQKRGDPATIRYALPLPQGFPENGVLDFVLLSATDRRQPDLEDKSGIIVKH